MTAITGIWSFNEWEIPVHYGDRMLQQFQGFRYDQVQTIRERRLFLSCSLNWITPQSMGEEIPYYNREKGLAIICNSIIDNREDLYQLLNIRKYERYMITDSQLILYAYEKWGEDCPRFLVGDFVFMIWNDKKQTWFGARDFSGTRTLYFTKNALFFSFASTMGALLTLPEVEDTYNENWIAEYLANPLTIESVDLTSTVYQSIYQIPPSHSITITKHHTQFKQYCHLLEEREPLKLKNDEQYIEAFQELFQKVVDSKLRTFKGKGAHLSGGWIQVQSLHLRPNHYKGNRYILSVTSLFPSLTIGHPKADKRTKDHGLKRCLSYTLLSFRTSYLSLTVMLIQKWMSG